MSLSSTSDHASDAAPGDPKDRRSFRLPLLEGGFGLAGERKAIALLCLAFYMAFYWLLSLILYNAPPDEPQLRAWWACFAALGGVYGTAFFALGADWFWARWFAVGLGYSGLTVAGWGMVQMRAIERSIRADGQPGQRCAGWARANRVWRRCGWLRRSYARWRK